VADPSITAYSAQLALEALLPASDLSLLHREAAGLAGQLLMITCHGVAFAALTFVMLWRRDSKAAR
jgi:hypothetical protein